MSDPITSPIIKKQMIFLRFISLLTIYSKNNEMIIPRIYSEEKWNVFKRITVDDIIKNLSKLLFLNVYIIVINE